MLVYELTEYMIDKMNMIRSLTDPCVIFKKLDDIELFKVVTRLNVNDTMLLGRRKDAQEFVDKISKRFNVTVQHEMRKHLGVDYEWGKDEIGHYAKATMKKYEREICLLYTSTSPRDATLSRMPSSA